MLKRGWAQQKGEKGILQSEIQDALHERHTRAVQEKLDRARVAVAGLGGLGSNVAMALARIGVGHLLLIDGDRVELSNLNRQQYTLRHVGLTKAQALREELLEINPYLDIRAECVTVTEGNLAQLLADVDIICEAFDGPEQKAMLVNGVLGQLPGKQLVAASGMAGYGKSNEIHTRQVGRGFYLCGDEVSWPEPGRGLMAPRAALCAAHQANLITQLILDGCG